MAIGCVSEYTQELKEQLDEAQKGYQSKYFEETWGELFREVMPEVEKTIKEGTERMLAFEDDPEVRELLINSDSSGKFSPEEKREIEKEKGQQEVVGFRTLSGEFEIKQTPAAYLPIEEVKRIYREETPYCVVENMRGVAHINRLKQGVDENGKPKITLGEHHSYRAKEGPCVPEIKSKIFLYRHPEKILAIDSRPAIRSTLRSGDPEKIRQALAQKERETHYHEIGEEIYDTHLTVEEKEECDRMYKEAREGDWMEKVCAHHTPSAREFFCDAHKIFKTDPQGLKAIDEKMFRFVQNKVISLEVKDTFASLEDKEDKEEKENYE